MNNEEYTRSLENRILQLEKEIEDKFLRLCDKPTYSTICSLIEEKKSHYRKHNVRYDGRGSAAMFLKENCTLTINLGRQMGHTTALQKYHTSNPLYSMYVVISRFQLNNYKNGLVVDDLEKPGSTITKKIFLLDNFLSSSDTTQKFFKAISDKIILQGEPPVIIMT